MARYHVNTKGEPGVCRARVACPYGSFDRDHFDSLEEARAAYEAGRTDDAFATLRKATDEVLDSALESDDELLAAIDRAGWPKFDPTLGPDQFDEAQALTDEEMAEMAAYYEARPTIEVAPAFEEEGSYSVLANGKQAFVTNSREVAEVAERVAAAGQWTAVEEVPSSGKFVHLRRFLSKDLEYLADAKLDLEERLAQPRDPAPRAVQRRNLDAEQYKLVQAAIAVKFYEEETRRAAKLLPNAEPPF